MKKVHFCLLHTTALCAGCSEQRNILFTKIHHPLCVSSSELELARVRDFLDSTVWHPQILAFYYIYMLCFTLEFGDLLVIGTHCTVMRFDKF